MVYRVKVCAVSPDDQAGTCGASPDWYTRQEVIPPGDCHGNEPGRLRAGAGRNEGRTHLLPGAGLKQRFHVVDMSSSDPQRNPTLMGSAPEPRAHPQVRRLLRAGKEALHDRGPCVRGDAAVEEVLELEQPPGRLHVLVGGDAAEPMSSPTARRVRRFSKGKYSRSSVETGVRSSCWSKTAEVRSKGRSSARSPSTEEVSLDGGSVGAGAGASSVPSAAVAVAASPSTSCFSSDSSSGSGVLLRLLAHDLLELEGGQLQELDGLPEERDHHEPLPLRRGQWHRHRAPQGGTELGGAATAA